MSSAAANHSESEGPSALLRPPGQSKGIRVQVRDLKKSFRKVVALDRISFEVNPGEVFVIMGPSGSGKTVLLKHLIGLESPDSGQIEIDGEPVSSRRPSRCRMAMVFQSGALLNSLTVGENVGLYLAEHRLKTAPQITGIVAEKLKLVGLQGMEDRYPNELSGGMKKRVGIARALVMEPNLILYDEPTSELDPISAFTIAEHIVLLKRQYQVTSIVVTHDRDLAFGIADRLALIHLGKILTVGTPAQVKASTDPMVQKFLNIEFNF